MNSPDVEMHPAPVTRVKAVLIGDAGVGKTCICTRLAIGKFDPAETPTVGVALTMIRSRGVDGIEYDISLWDTAGQERFRTIVPLYFEAADFILATYSCADRNSFMSVRSWIATARDRAPTAKIILLANKTDLDPWIVSTAEMETLGVELEVLQAIETSAMNGVGLDSLIATITDNAPEPLFEPQFTPRADTEVRGCC
jgi:small GTP-binding protein